MKDITERKEFKECIEAMKLRFMKAAVDVQASHDDRHEAALKHHLIDRVVVEMANYNPEEKQNGKRELR